MKWAKVNNLYVLEVPGLCDLIVFRKQSGGYGWFLNSFRQELTGERGTLEAAMAEVEDRAYKLIRAAATELTNDYVKTFGGENKKHYILSMEPIEGGMAYTLRTALSLGTRFQHRGKAYEVISIAKNKDFEHWVHDARLLE